MEEGRETDSFPISQIHDPHPGKLVWWCLLARLTGVDKMAWKILRTRGAGRKRGRDGRASNRRKVGEGVSKLLPSLTRPYFHRYYSIGKKRRKIKDRALTVDSRRDDLLARPPTIPSMIRIISLTSITNHVTSQSRLKYPS